MVKVVAIPPENIDQFWPVLEPMYSQALEKMAWDQYDTDDLHSMIEDGETLALVVAKDAKIIAALGLNLVSHPKKRECVILIAGGDAIDEWLEPVNEAIIGLAKEQQADSVVIHGRDGWVRKLKHLGYEKQYITVAMEL
jgi:hypothetical protein